MNLENEKVDCIDALTFGLTRTRDWRQKMATKYPNDPRNIRAADCLTKLAAEAPALIDQDWLLLRPYAGWASEQFREGISEASRSVGFKKKITDIHSYVLHLLDVLSLSQSIAA
jgi:hypothetical protein